MVSNAVGTEGEVDINGHIVSAKRAADRRTQRSRKIIDEEREKYIAKNGFLRNTTTDSNETIFCDFDKPRKRAYQKQKIKSNEQSKGKAK